MEIERIMWSWPRVVAAAENDWSKSFAKSIAIQARRKTWTPSDKQAALMRSMVSQLHTHNQQQGGDFSVIEDD